MPITNQDTAITCQFDSIERMASVSTPADSDTITVVALNKTYILTVRR